MEKRCLIIDNEDQSSSIEEIQRLGKSSGLTILCDEFNVGMLSKDEFITDNKIDINKVINEFKIRHKSHTYHLAAFDWDFGDDIINGVELIRKFQENGLLTKTPKILYSGILKDEISSQLDKFERGALPKSKLITWINTLIKVDVKNFVDRISYEREVITQLLKTDETLDLIIEEELKKFPQLIFQNSFTSNSFNGKTFSEIAKAIEENDLMRNQFKKEIVQQVIAYLTEKI